MPLGRAGGIVTVACVSVPPASTAVTPAGAPTPSNRTPSGVVVKPMPWSVSFWFAPRPLRTGVTVESHGVTAKVSGALARPFNVTVTSACGPALRSVGKVTLSDDATGGEAG